MKDKILITCCLVVLVAIAGCEQQKAESTKEVEPLKDYHVRVIDGCEYLVFEEYGRGMPQRALAVTHKGDCSNPRHNHP